MTHFLHAHAHADELATARIVTFALILITFTRVEIHQLASLPTELVEPRGVMRLLPLDSILSSADALWALKIALMVGCLACILGVNHFHAVAVPTVLLALFHDGAMRSVAGFDIHVRLTLIYVAAILALSPCIDAYALARRRRPASEGDTGLRYSGPLLIMSLVVTLTYSLVGTRRLLEQGASLFTSETASIWMLARSIQPSEYGFTAGLWLLDHPWLGTMLTLGMFVTTLFEAASPLALRFPTFRWMWIVAVGSFHVGVLLGMNIAFTENVVLILLLFTPVTSVVSRFVARWRTRDSGNQYEPTDMRRRDPG